MIQGLIISLAVSLLLTIILETGFFFIVKIRKWNKKDLGLVILVNIITNPIVVLLNWLTVMYTEYNTVIILILLEIFAIVTEGCYYKKYGKSFGHPYLFSFLANMFSYWIGILIQLLS